MRHIYGPVESRRLGFSLGISLTPQKVCTFDCIYCQLGNTTYKTNKTMEYIPVKEVIDELRTFLQAEAQTAAKLKYITLSGFGEPTLNTKIGELISEVKQLTKIPICLMTNSSLLADANIRKNIMHADLIVPTLCTVDQDDFETISRPFPDIKVADIIQGLVNLRKEFAGEIWLEVMIIKGFNDDIRKIKKLKEAVDLIRPNKIQLNSPIRAPMPQMAASVDKAKLEKICHILGENCVVV